MLNKRLIKRSLFVGLSTLLLISGVGLANSNSGVNAKRANRTVRVARHHARKFNWNRSRSNSQYNYVMKHKRSGRTFKVRISKAVRVNRIKPGKFSALNKVVGYTYLRKGQIVTIQDVGAGGISWSVYGGCYGSSRNTHPKYLYSLGWPKQGTFNLIHENPVNHNKDIKTKRLNRIKNAKDTFCDPGASVTVAGYGHYKKYDYYNNLKYMNKVHNNTYTVGVKVREIKYGQGRNHNRLYALVTKISGRKLGWINIKALGASA